MKFLIGRKKCDCQRDSNKFLKLLWVLIFSLSLVGLFFYISEIYLKWKFNPDIMTTERIVPSYEIPMPAITICSPLLVKKSVIDMREKSDLNYTSDDINQQCYPLYWQSCNMALSIKLSEKYSKINFKNPIQTFSECSHTLEETFSRCWFQRKEVRCEDILNRVITDFGFCFSINMLDMGSIFTSDVDDDFKMSYEAKASKIFNTKQVDWNLTDGFKNSSIKFPIRAIKRNQLQFTMSMERADLTNLCISRTKSFGIILHLPNEMPTAHHPENYVEMDQFKTIQLDAKRFTADESLRKYLPSQRRCLFEGERKLKFFVSYTKAHCHLECLTNFTYATCGCVKFSMPRTKDMKVCNFNMSKCIFEADLSWAEYEHERNSALSECNCLPTCFNIKYSVLYEKSSIYQSDEIVKTTNQM